ncbi:Clusterin-associated protein 1 [Geodia barretti]|nr:Clusterin-associated protein 1 [Geodia barretti]
MMRALGYPRLISMENFRTPNFQLVAEILAWLVNRYDPSADLPTEVDTEQDRVIFIKSIAQFMATKAHVKLNTKKLYMADGHAVKELLKISSLLYTAMTTHQKSGLSEDTSTQKNMELSVKSTDLKACRQLASEITARGAKLHELLGREVELRDLRRTALSQTVDIEELERGIASSISAVKTEIERVQQMLGNLGGDEASLEVKIENKRQELERNQKRLRSLANVRPAYMDEYERVEVDLQKQYSVYVEKHCHLSYLEHQLDLVNEAEHHEHEATESSLKRMHQRMQEAEHRMIRDDITADDMLQIAGTEEFPRPTAEGRKVFGSMSGDAILSDHEEESNPLSSGSELASGGEEDEDEKTLDFSDGDQSRPDSADDF